MASLCNMELIVNKNNSRGSRLLVSISRRRSSIGGRISGLLISICRRCAVNAELDEKNGLMVENKLTNMFEMACSSMENR